MVPATAHGARFKAVIEFLARVGSGLTEHSYKGEQTPQGFGTGTPAMAKEPISMLRGAWAFTVCLVAGDSKVQAEWTQLDQTAYLKGASGF